MSQIAEAYFHLKRIRATDVRLQSIGDFASRIAAEAALGHFSDDSVIEVRISEGSLKGWILVIGILSLEIYGKIADYKGFKDSIAEINSDARSFSDTVLRKVLSSDEVRGATIYRTERRTKTPGRIKRLIERREWLEAHRRQLPPNVVEQEEMDIEKLLQKILIDLEPSQQQILREILNENSPHLPIPELPKAALPIARREKPLIFEGMEAVGGAQLDDYVGRFRLSDWPSLKSSLQFQSDSKESLPVGSLLSR